MKTLEITVTREKYVIDRLKIMMGAIESVASSSDENPLTLEKAEQVFSMLKVNVAICDCFHGLK